MKTKFILLILIFGNSIIWANESKLSFLNSYLTIKNALIKSDGNSAMQEAKTAYNQLSFETGMPEAQELLKLVHKIAITDDITKQRKALGPLSILLWKLIKSDNSIDQKLFYNYCPMKDVHWISEFEAIKNPYYGSKMLSCGSVSETKN